MVRPSDFVDAEYDRKLAEYKAAKARAAGKDVQESSNSDSRCNTNK